MDKASTPMMEQYWQVKAAHPDKLVFFRLGDFWELFFEDAEIASRVLSLTLTARANKHERIPMCGVPYHAAEPYIHRLVTAGHKVVLCDQVEPATPGKKLVRREVVRILTPGTFIEHGAGESTAHTFLTAVATDGQAWALASADLATGTCQVTDMPGAGGRSEALEELRRLLPAECLLSSEWVDLQPALSEVVPVVTLRPPDDFGDGEARRRVGQHFGKATADTLGRDAPLRRVAVGALLAYLEETQRQHIRHLAPPRIYRRSDYLVLDSTARRHLELTERLSDGSRQQTLLQVLDHTRTAMGSRLLRNWLEQPLKDVKPIDRRLAAVEALAADELSRQELRTALHEIYDLQRLAARLALGSVNARDLVALRKSLRPLPSIKHRLSLFKAGLLRVTDEQVDDMADLYQLLSSALLDDPPASLTEGQLFRDGYHQEVDSLRDAMRDGTRWLGEMEARERARTGIRSLKVRYNKVFGYYLEVTHANRDLVPADYERKQTLANAERFVTPELKEMEARILGAEERLVQLEYELFQALRDQLVSQLARVQGTAMAIAQLDVLLSMAETAVRYGYVRPTVYNDGRLVIEEGRHPVVERQPEMHFVPNDVALDTKGTCMGVVTGPNMGGKSTYLRQVALTLVLAQMGSFVPARKAEIGLVDRIFTRISAADELSRGYSTFMVEIQEALEILLAATPRSLAIIDELGRGTSTFDGIAFSKAYLEYLYRHIGCRTLVSTHFFELTDLAQHQAGVENLHVGATLDQERLVFSYTVQRGPADRSYGVEVARMAGMPTELILRAREILASLEAQQPATMEVLAESGATDDRDERVPRELRRLIAGMAGLNILHMTPLQAMETLQELSDHARNLLAWYDEKVRTRQ